MSEAKHTPGSWTSHREAPSLIYVPQSGLRLFTIGYNCGYRPGREERRANSLLIAAAPDLLEALKLILELESEADEMAALETAVKQARAVIAKAEGKA